MVNILSIRRLLSAGILTSIVFAHPFHVSITTFQLNPNTHSIEITMKLFTDDLEDAIQYKGLPPVKLGSKNEYIKSDSLIFRYLKKHLSLSLDQKGYEFQWVGKEIENDITWCYFEVESVDRFFVAAITNSIFVANFNDQLNISHFYKGNQTETIMHHKGDISGTIEFQSEED
ncbi:hypothetical protein JYT44_02145 [Caldithrix abyssi]|nr:hypothetical protein [Caldithrix abyssi]